jgi:hypothetical protein
MNGIYVAAVLILSAEPVVQKSEDDLIPSDASVADGGTAKPPKAGKPGLNVEKMPFTRESVRRVMAAHRDEIQSCYEETLAGKDKPVEGQIMTSFVITGEGTVKRVRVLKKGTSLNDQKLHDCVVSTLSSLSFPKPPDGRDYPIEYPFNLKASR